MQTANPPMPKPKRSKRRWFLVGGFMLILLATPLVYLLVATYWQEQELEQIYREMDAEDPHWRWPNLVKQMPPVPPDERNAMVQLTKVIGIMKPTPVSMGPLGGRILRPKNARLTDADEQRIRVGLATLPPTTVTEALKLKDMPEGGVAVDPAIGPLDVRFDAAFKVLNVMHVLEHVAVLRAHEGQMEDAADACLAILHSAHALGDLPVLMAQLLRTAGQIQAVLAIERTLGQGVVDEERLKALQNALAVEANHNGVYHAMRGERAFTHEVFLAYRDGRLPAEKFPLSLRGQWHALSLYARLRDYPAQLRWQNELIRACKILDLAQIEALDTAGQKLTLIDARGSMGPNYLAGQVSSQLQDRVRVRCAVAAIAAERYRLKHDRWPAGIAELVRDGLLKAPISDPYDGQPLRFQRTDTGLIVYSIGADKIDNQGKTGDIRFELWHRQLRAIQPAMEKEK